MPAYRAFPLDSNGRVAHPAIDLECASDVEAAAQAVALAKECDLDVWEGGRYVCTVKREADVAA